MAWTNFAIDFPTCENSNESYWSNLIAQSWTAWSNFSSYLGTAYPLAYTDLNTTRWIWGDTSCGCKFTYTNDYSASFTFYLNNEIYLAMPCEPARVNTSGNALYMYVGVDETNQYGSCFLMYKSGNQCINRNLGYSKTNWQNPMYQIIKAGGLVVPITSNGGGATHIAKRSGLLSSIGASNLSDILMVSGGGGGGLIIGEDVYAGKDAGGIAGSGNNSADQTTGYAFGQGESDEGVSGGGGGLYGGYKGGS